MGLPDIHRILFGLREPLKNLWAFDSYDVLIKQKAVPNMTYYVFGGTFSLAQLSR